MRPPMRHAAGHTWLRWSGGPTYGRSVGEVTGQVAPSVVRIASTSGPIEVTAEPRDDVEVNGDARVRTEDATVTIDETKGRLEVLVPERTDLVIGSNSGRIVIDGPTGDVAVTTVSGRIEVADALSLDVRSETSRVDVNEIVGHCRVRTGTGRIQIGGCGGHADLTTERGRIEVQATNGSVRAHCVSGRIVVGLNSANDVEAETVTGRIDVSLPSGTRPYNPAEHGLQDLTPDGYDCTVTTRSISGQVTVETR